MWLITIYDPETQKSEVIAEECSDKVSEIVENIRNEVFVFVNNTDDAKLRSIYDSPAYRKAIRAAVHDAVTNEFFGGDPEVRKALEEGGKDD